jgi:hypothetical protein
LEYADCLNVNFEMQKKDEKNDTTTQMASGDISLCPVRAAAAIVRRIRSYPGAKDNTPVSAFWKYDRIDNITSQANHKCIEGCRLSNWGGLTPHRSK